VNPVRGCLLELDVLDTTAAGHPLTKVGLTITLGLLHEQMIGALLSNQEINPTVTVVASKSYWIINLDLSLKFDGKALNVINAAHQVIFCTSV
ncbi:MULTISPECIES: hypothetical protein, partial [Enterobacter cloacae complex]